MTAPTAPVVATGMFGGFVLARYSPHPAWGAALLAGAGAWSARSWLKTSGPRTAGALSATYVAAFVGAHPLAKKVGKWGSMAIVTSATAAAAYVLADRRV